MELVPQPWQGVTDVVGQLLHAHTHKKRRFKIIINLYVVTGKSLLPLHHKIKRKASLLHSVLLSSLNKKSTPEQVPIVSWVNLPPSSYLSTPVFLTLFLPSSLVHNSHSYKPAVSNPRISFTYEY